MNTSTVALSLDSIDRGAGVVLPRHGQRASHAPVAKTLQQSANVIAALAIAPLVLAAFAALLFAFTAKLIVALVAVGFES